VPAGHILIHCPFKSEKLEEHVLHSCVFLHITQLGVQGTQMLLFAVKPTAHDYKHCPAYIIKPGEQFKQFDEFEQLRQPDEQDWHSLALSLRKVDVEQPQTPLLSLASPLQRRQLSASMHCWHRGPQLVHILTESEEIIK
jgi:hypothetical protein